MLSSQVSATVVLLAFATVLALLGVAQGQNYHYSNGWHPGKRADMINEALYSGVHQDQCRFKPRVITFINQLLTEEISRMKRSCSVARAFSRQKMLLEQTPMQQAEARQKLQEVVDEEEEEARENTKW